MLPVRKILCASFAGVVFPCLLLAQKEIRLNNPSFEDIPAHSHTPQGWFNCGHPGESPPDVQPGAFNVTRLPSDGRTYLGLVVRDNETNESVGQRLSAPLEANKCYEFTIDLCRSERYLSLSRATAQPANYSEPVVLRIWGGNGYCQKSELLYKTEAITNTHWRPYHFQLRPKYGNYQYLTLEAFYKTPTLLPYNGNILLDNASTIRQSPCDTPIAARKPSPQPPDTKPVQTAKGADPTPAKPQGRPSAPDSATSAPPTVSVPNEETLLSRSTLREGATFQLNNLYFDADKCAIKDVCLPALEAVYRFLIENPDVIIEVGGHTNELPTYDDAMTLSINRAKAVADWLIGKGIPKERILYKGYGKTRPIDSSMTDEAHRRNQRVEFKIISMSDH